MLILLLVRAGIEDDGDIHKIINIFCGINGDVGQYFNLQLPPLEMS
jgi:hypothetical protein